MILLIFHSRHLGRKPAKKKPNLRMVGIVIIIMVKCPRNNLERKKMYKKRAKLPDYSGGGW